MDRLEMLKRMMVIREFECIIKKLARTKEVDGAIHCYTGEEAVAVGVCAALSKRDYVFSTHRGHGHAAAPVPGHENTPGRVFKVLRVLNGRFDEDCFRVCYFLVHSPIPFAVAPSRSASLRKSLSLVTTVTLPLAPAYRLIRR